MKKLLLAAAVGLLGQTTVANAATDWTPIFKPMLSGCEDVNVATNLPSKYKVSIASKKVKGNPDNETEAITTTYTLKNATAFGQSLSKVEYIQEYEGRLLTLYFKNDKFMALRPQFKPPVLDEYSEITRNDANGYEFSEFGYLSLDFNEKAKTISCAAGL